MKYVLMIAVLLVPSLVLAQCQSNAAPQNQVSALDLQLLQRGTAAPLQQEPSQDAIQRAVDRAIQQMQNQQGAIYNKSSQLSSAARDAVRSRVNRNVQQSQAPPQPCADGACDLDAAPVVAKTRTNITSTSFSAFKKRYTRRDKIVSN